MSDAVPIKHRPKDGNKISEYLTIDWTPDGWSYTVTIPNNHIYADLHFSGNHISYFVT